MQLLSMNSVKLVIDVTESGFTGKVYFVSCFFERLRQEVLDALDITKLVQQLQVLAPLHILSKKWFQSFHSFDSFCAIGFPC